jgi:CheY-like chemotaxis protein
MELVEGTYQLSAMLNDLNNMISVKAREKGLDFSIDVDESLPDSLYGDEVRVRQIITNILSNAVKYTPSGSVRMTLRGESSRPFGSGETIRLVVVVEDTGVGIRREDIDKLFVKFQRLDLNQNSTVEGTGLGLAITHRLLDRMGGSIDVKSEYGRGSVFTVTIPQKIVAAAPVGNLQAQFQTGSQKSVDYRESFQAPEACVLIVDDTKMNLMVVVGLLRSTRIQIDTASSGEEALVYTRDRSYDLILMDQRMPIMDGTEALHRVRSQSGGANRETPIICLTADAVIGAKERYLDQGFTDYLTKPIDTQALERMLMTYLPEEKIIPMKSEDFPVKAGEGPADKSGYAPLREAGIDPEIGLRYCQMDDDFYRTLLAEYACGAEQKLNGLRRSYDAQEWKNYATVSHSIKSTSRMIGASALADLAERLEKAADAEDLPALKENHIRLTTQFESVAAAIRSEVSCEETSSEDDEIMEFLPEE